MKAISKIEKGTIPVVDVSGFTVGDRYSSIYFSEEALYLKTIDTLHPTIIYKYTDTVAEPIDYALEREKIRNDFKHSIVDTTTTTRRLFDGPLKTQIEAELEKEVNKYIADYKKQVNKNDNISYFFVIDGVWYVYTNPGIDVPYYAKTVAPRKHKYSRELEETIDSIVNPYVIEAVKQFNTVIDIMKNNKETRIMNKKQLRAYFKKLVGENSFNDLQKKKKKGIYLKTIGTLTDVLLDERIENALINVK